MKVWVVMIKDRWEMQNWGYPIAVFTDAKKAEEYIQSFPEINGERIVSGDWHVVKSSILELDYPPTQTDLEREWELDS